MCYHLMTHQMITITGRAVGHKKRERRHTMAAKDPFDLYPNIRSLNESLGCHRGAMDEFARYHVASLSVLECALPNLNFNKRPSLLALAADLFSDDFKKINAAICEITAFGWLKAKGLIDESAIGYPSDWNGDDPPFEGSLQCGEEDLPFDVKDGSGSGVQLLNNVLLKTLKYAAVAASVPVPSLRVAVNAPSGQRWFSDYFGSIVRPFREELEKNGFADRVLYFEAGSGRVAVGLNRSVGGSIIGITEKASFLASQVLSHAQEKDKKLRLTSASRFLLIYLRRLHSGGADFDEHIMPKAFDFLAGMPELPKSLAGVLFVNFEFQEGRTSPDSVLWDRAGDLASCLGDAANRVHVANTLLMPKLHCASARALTPANIEATGATAISSCDLRGPGCSARGSSGAIHIYFSDGQQYGACHECVETFKWPMKHGRVQPLKEE